MPLFCSHCGTENNNDAPTCKACDSRVGHLKDSDNASKSKNPYQSPTEDSANAQSGGTQGSGIQSLAFWAVSGVVCAIYLVNPGAGFLEFIPDNIPVIGNLDEAAATTGLLLSLAKFGLNPFWKK